MASCVWYHCTVLCENGELCLFCDMKLQTVFIIYVYIYSFFYRNVFSLFFGEREHHRNVQYLLDSKIKADSINSVFWHRGRRWVMRWLTAHFSTIPQQQTSCKRSTWCFFFSAEDISAYDVWQIHAAGGFTALRPHARNSLTTLIDRTYCAHFKSRRSVWWEESGRGGAETLRNGSETYEFTCIYTNRPMTHDASLDKHLWGTTVSNSISTQTWKIIITQSTSRIRCVTHRNTREAGDIPIMEGCLLILQVAGWSGVVGKPWNDSQKYITVDNLVAAQACRRVTGENHFLKHRVEACSVQNNRLAALLFISSSITGLICRDEKCQGNGKRCFVWLVIHLTFYLFGQHTGLSDNLLALFLRKPDTSYFLAPQSCQRQPGSVTLYIFRA